MSDVFSKKKRSLIMSKIRSCNTNPERAVRSILHRMGFRFRIHKRNLPGCPDIVLPRFKTTIFVHGCFWHGHKVCRKGRRPSTNVTFWNDKLDKNIRRDRLNKIKLKKLDWHVITIWECEINKPDRLFSKLEHILDGQ